MQTYMHATIHAHNLYSYMSIEREIFEGQNGGPPREGGSGVLKKPVLQMVQSEVFLSYFCEYPITCIKSRLNYA